MKSFITINGREIGPGCPPYVIAEMSANHGGSYEYALRILEAAKVAGAHAVKLQTYTADTMTIDCDNEHFRIKGTIWEGQTLYGLYEEAHTPWEWFPGLKEKAVELGLDLFSSPFDSTAVNFLESQDVPAYKVASFELVDIPLIRKLAQTGRPVIMSTGMASLEEIEEAVSEFQNAGGDELALLKCTSAYPASPEEANLRTLVDMGERFGVPVGVSDHTLGNTVSVAAVSLGACVVEKHFTLDRSDGGPDASFSLEPQEFKCLAEEIGIAYASLGDVHYQATEKQAASLAFRRSLFVVADMEAGDVFDVTNVRCIRPSMGLHPRHLSEVIGRRASKNIRRGTPLSWDVVE